MIEKDLRNKLGKVFDEFVEDENCVAVAFTFVDKEGCVGTMIDGTATNIALLAANLEASVLHRTPETKRDNLRKLMQSATEISLMENDVKSDKKHDVDALKVLSEIVSILENTMDKKNEGAD